MNCSRYSISYCCSPVQGMLKLTCLRVLQNWCGMLYGRTWFRCWTSSQTMQWRQKKGGASDHHNGWRICCIAREVLSRELVLPFARTQLAKERPNLSVSVFYKSLMTEVQDSTYLLVAEILFEFIDAMFLNRTGVCNAKSDIAGRVKLAKLWNRRNHPQYRELELTGNLLYTRAPEKVKHHNHSTKSLNTSGSAHTGEGADLRLEELNQRVQQWLPRAPSGRDWEIACGQYDGLSDMRSALFEDPGVKGTSPLPTKRPIQRDLPIQSWSWEITAKYYDKFISTEDQYQHKRTIIPFKEALVFVKKSAWSRSQWTTKLYQR